jgi:hypothetical protein
MGWAKNTIISECTPKSGHVQSTVLSSLWSYRHKYTIYQYPPHTVFQLTPRESQYLQSLGSFIENNLLLFLLSVQ